MRFYHWIALVIVALGVVLTANFLTAGTAQGETHPIKYTEGEPCPGCGLFTRTPPPTGTQPTATPSATPRTCESYDISQATGTFVPATNFVSGSNCDDCVVGITLPFPVALYGQTFTSANVSSN